TLRWDLRTNMFDFDASLERLFGLQAGGKPRSLSEFVELVHPHDRARVLAACERAAKRSEGLDLEYRVTLPDGTTRWLNEKGRMFFDDNERASYMVGACVDVTKRKQAETFVWRQRDVLEQIVQGAPLADVLETLTLDIEGER